MDILTSSAGGVLTLQFNRPQRKNAITSAMYMALAHALRDAQNDPAVRAIVILGQPEIFTAGNDLEDFMKGIGQTSDVPAV
ncbi:MAG TPA: enoyl-CoA hydratase-related protein, partial [Burkholderiaceae bacterium]